MQRMSLARKVCMLAVLASGAAASAASAQTQDFDAVQIEVLHVQKNVYMLVGAGGNITAQIGEDGVLLVDTQYAPLTDKLLAALRTISDKPIHYVINTHAHPDHVGGNENFYNNSGLPGNVGPGTGVTNASYSMKILAHENVLLRMSEPEPAGTRAALWPTDTYFTPDKELYFNGEGIRLIHQPAAHTDGDTLVHFRGADVISAGDVYVNTLYPVIDRARGGSIQGIIAGLNSLLHLIIPRSHGEDGTLVVPGHGRIADEADVVEYRDMVVIIHDRIARMVEAGMNLRQVVAARPTREYDPRYGADSGFWTTAAFVEAVYRDVGGK